jgi:signal transduction histidine kinase
MDRKRVRYVAAGVFLGLYLLVCLLAPEGPGLMAFRDFTRLGLLTAAIFILGRHLAVTTGRERVFWGLLTVGAALWLIPQIWRMWYQVLARVAPPDSSVSHIVLFLHVIPLMAALALRPNERQHERTLLLDFLNTGMLLVWWIYLYAFMIVAWQTRLMMLPELSNFYFSILYFAENIVLASGAAILFLRSGRGWKNIYGSMFFSATLYAAGALLLDRLTLHVPNRVSVISDALIVAALLLFAGVGIERAAAPPAAGEEALMTNYGVWQGRFAMLALLSMPCMALWVIYFSLAQPPVTVFRMTVAFAAIIALAVLIIVKQSMLNSELTRLLEQKQETMTKEKHLQDHLVSSEKMAALGQLVAGAAHEINNPLTAILGYSDLLEQEASLPEESRTAVQKIGQQARRTKRLVENLLNFAQQTPAEKTSVHINALLNNAVQLREPDLAGKKIKLKVKLQPELPRIRGDSNQLLQVFLHMMNNAIDALQEVGGGTLTITTASDEGWVMVQFSDTGPGIKEPQKIFDPFYTTKPVGQGSGLGLSACYGIIHDHGGEIDCENNPSGGATFKVKLPAEIGPQRGAPSPPEAVC